MEVRGRERDGGWTKWMKKGKRTRGEDGKQERVKQRHAGEELGEKQAGNEEN